MKDTISKSALLRLKAPDPVYAAMYQLPVPKFSERLAILKKSGCKQPRYLAERQHLINLRDRYHKYRKEIGTILRSDAHIKGAIVPYTLD